ncbi:MULTISPECIES: glycosyltransferase [Paenibacillus]|uniref:Glycosyltransferase n=1 Tax=Paenibacillus validus TaxID=44253 RepID=A0A7X3CR10_9BACL|nr:MULTISPECIES: glycosyltransferase [Paenibacillus]MUG70195.1 glycosyltransferase [Paenibacillus validus]
MNVRINSVLFIQVIPDIRTNKIANVLSQAGIQTDLLYLKTHPAEVYRGYALPYSRIFKLRMIKEIVEFVDQSSYDLVISCNEPDIISAVLACSTKPVIHDCHDMMSLRGDITNDQAILEFIANKYASANIYVTDLIKEIAVQRFGLSNKPVTVLDNYVLREQLPQQYLPKLSQTDGEIHCVYEGGLTNRSDHHRYIEPVLLALAQEKVHVHYYTPFQSSYYSMLEQKSPYLHWEGTREPNELIYEMTRYDVGLTVLHVTERNKPFLDSTFPNKAWDYLAAGLPILFSDLTSFQQFLKSYAVGRILDLSGHLFEQVRAASLIPINPGFLNDYRLTMEDQSDRLVEFLEEAVISFYKRSRE